jgi:hypothetical protein
MVTILAPAKDLRCDSECTHICNSGGSSRLRAMAGRSGQRAWHREPGTMSGYGVPVGLGERAGGEQCPQCGESDLRPHGNGSKWACPRCYFIVPCCEGGELAARPSANVGRGAPTADPGRPCSR